MRCPYEFLIAAARIIGRAPVDPGPILGGLNSLGQPLWSPAGPNGFADTRRRGYRRGHEGAARHILADRQPHLPTCADPVDMLDKIAGAAASTDTQQAIARAESKQQALALLLMSPEVQRR